MANTRISISNLALACLGAEAIQSMTESNKRARMCDVFFDAVANALLTRLDWSFARKYTELTQLSGIETPDRYYVYGLPIDNLVIRRMYPFNPRESWSILGERFICNRGSEVYVFYTALVPDPASYTPQFVTTLATALAIKIGPAITQDKKLMLDLREQYKIELADSAESDANIGNYYMEVNENPLYDSFITPDSTT